MKIVTLLFAMTLSLAGCVRKDSARLNLYGSYAARGPDFDAIPGVTLEIARPNHYTFCRAGRCAAGTWLVQREGACNGRITFKGPTVESFVRELDTASGADPFWKQRGMWNEIDLDYRVCPDDAWITLGTGDAAFVKR